jgi:hypothetical protein
MSLIMLKTNLAAEKSMEELDPKAKGYKNSRKDRRKANDASYKGPERRLGKRREKELLKIIEHLEGETKN